MQCTRALDNRDDVSVPSVHSQGLPSGARRRDSPWFLIRPFQLWSSPQRTPFFGTSTLKIPSTPAPEASTVDVQGELLPTLSPKVITLGDEASDFGCSQSPDDIAGEHESQGSCVDDGNSPVGSRTSSPPSYKDTQEKTDDIAADQTNMEEEASPAVTPQAEHTNVEECLTSTTPGIIYPTATQPRRRQYNDALQKDGETVRHLYARMLMLCSSHFWSDNMEVYNRMFAMQRMTFALQHTLTAWHLKRCLDRKLELTLAEVDAILEGCEMQEAASSDYRDFVMARREYRVRNS